LFHTRIRKKQKEEEKRRKLEKSGERRKSGKRSGCGKVKKPGVSRQRITVTSSLKEISADQVSKLTVPDCRDKVNTMTYSTKFPVRDHEFDYWGKGWVERGKALFSPLLRPLSTAGFWTVI
jgi:hypothetical protein